MAQCRSCLAPIFWAVTKNGKLIPVDLSTNLDGNVEITPTGGDGPPLATVHAQAPALTTGTLHHTHFATCPMAADHRRRPAR
jgi:hypothetical protein